MKLAWHGIFVLLAVTNNVVFVGAVELFPFGSAAGGDGDESLPGVLDGSSEPQSTIGFANLMCPFYGSNESTLYVSCFNRGIVTIATL